MKKRIFSLLISVIMIFTMSLCVFAAEEESASLAIANFYGTKNTLYVKLNKSVTVSKTDPTATLTQYGSNAEFTATVTAEDTAESSDYLQIDVSPALSIDGKYKLTLTVGGNELTKSFEYETLYFEDFSNTSSFKLRSGTVVDGKLTRPDGQKDRPTPITTSCYVDSDNNINDNWSDYTVEFEYDDVTTRKGLREDATNFAQYFETHFYTQPDIGNVINFNSMNDYTNDGKSKGSALSTRTRANKPRFCYVGSDITATTSSADGKITYKNDNQYTSVTGTFTNIDNKNVVYSASLFGNNIYTSLTDTTDNKILYTEYGTAESLKYSKGGFAVVANATYSYKETTGEGEEAKETTKNDSQTTYIDNLRAYKVKEFPVDYNANENVTLYGSKKLIVAKFEKDVINADAVITDFSEAVKGSTSNYDPETKTLEVTMDKALDIDGKYILTINYGAGKEYTITKNIEYKTLYFEDFSDTTNIKLEKKGSITVNANGHGARSDGSKDRGLAINKDSYINSDGTIKDDWSDYTVEFEYYDTESRTDLVENETPAQILHTYFYVQKDGSNLDLNSLINGSDSNISYTTLGLQVVSSNKNATSMQYAYLEDGNTATTNYEKVNNSTVFHYTKGVQFDSTTGSTDDINNNNIVSSTSLFGTNLYTSLTKIGDNDAFYTGKGVVKNGLRFTSGGFAVSARMEYSGNNLLAYIDNIRAYKLATFETNYTNNEEIVMNGNKNYVFAQFDENVISAAATIKDFDGNTVDSTSTYSSEDELLEITPASALDLNKKYTVEINYGAGKKYTITKIIRFDQLFFDDFSNQTSTDKKFTNTGYISNVEGYLTKTSKNGQSKDPQYSAQINTNNFLNADGTVKDEWKDYTVEFDYNDEKSIANIAEDSTSKPALEVCFYYTKNPTRALRDNALYSKTDGTNELAPVSLAVTTSDSVNSVRYLKVGNTSQEDANKNEVKGTVSKGSFSGVLGKTVTYSASVWGNKIYTSITDKTNNATTPFYVATAKTEGNYYNEKGGFAVRASNKHKKTGESAESDQQLTYMDNVCAYKLIATDSTEFAVDYTVAKNADAKTVTVTLGTANDTQKAYTPIVAVYGDNGILMGVCYGNEDNNTLTVNNIENVNYIREIKVMFWSNDDNCQPLTAAEIKQPITSIASSTGNTTGDETTGNTTGDETQTDSSTGESDLEASESLDEL